MIALRVALGIPLSMGHWRLLAFINGAESPEAIDVALYDEMIEPQMMYWKDQVWRVVAVYIDDRSIYCDVVPAGENAN
jgi:hypothetical protein